jgi:hypothetical protein
MGVTNESTVGTLSFSDIEHLQGIQYQENSAQDDFPLPTWYAGVRKTPIKEFSVYDLIGALRQDLYHEWVVPVAIGALTRNH